MKRLLLLALLLTLSGCGTNPEELVKESLGCWQEAAEVLETIQDEDSAKAAEPKLRALLQRMGELNRQARQHELPPEQLAKLQADNEETTRIVLGRVREASKKAADIPGCAAIVYRFNRQAAAGLASP